MELLTPGMVLSIIKMGCIYLQFYNLLKEKGSLANYPGITHWDSALEGLQASSADILVEVTPTNLRDAEPGMSHIRTALTKGMHVVTANKGPAALAANELVTLARQYGVQLRMESTVMSGTPVISTIHEGMAGAQVIAMRGILNGTTNYILSAMAYGRDYVEALADAQAKGYAETDPTADVEGYDAVAKTLILAGLVFGYTLKPERWLVKASRQLPESKFKRPLTRIKGSNLLLLYGSFG